MGQIISVIGKEIKDSAGNPIESFYLNACKPLGVLRFSQPTIFKSKADKDAKCDPIRIKELTTLEVVIDKTNYMSGSVPAIGYAQCREQLKTLLNITDSEILND